MDKKNFDSFVIGTVLGDSSLCGKKNKYIFTGHCESQLEYLKWKAEMIRQNLPVGINLKVSKAMSSPSGNRQPFYKLFTTSHHRLTAIYSLIYDEKNKKHIDEKILKKLTPLGIAVLYMDDGCIETAWNRNKTIRKIKNYSICFGKFPTDEVILFSNMLLNKYKIESKIYTTNKGTNNLKITTEENRLKFMQLIEPYILNCMLYKIKIQE